MTSPWMPRPPSAEPVVVVHAAEVGAVVFQALVRDRVVRRVRGETGVRADAVTTPQIRAAALLPLVPERCVVGRQAALWVHTGLHEPPRIAVLVAPRRRRPDPHPVRVTHEAVLAPDDVVSIGPLRVTSVQQTGLDLARWFTRTEAVGLLQPLCAIGFDARAALRRLDGLEGFPGTLEARRTLQRVAGQQVVQERIAGSSDALAPVSR